MDSIKLFISCIKFLQNLTTAIPYKYYEKAHHSLFKKFFRLSSVSISFRICFKPEVLDRIKEEHKSQIKTYLIDFVNDDKNYLYSDRNFIKNKSSHITKILNIDSLQKFLNEKFYQYTDIKSESVNNLLSVEILLVKRAPSLRDKYSGNVAFPGGKFEKEDVNDLNTAIRETQEEIGLNLSEDTPIVSRYLGPNTRFDITLDFRYLVTSHMFLIFDFFRESENYFVISKNELSDVFYVPLDYLLQIDHMNQKSYDRPVLHKILGNEAYINKLILNQNENFLVYGLTLRKIINFLNVDGQSNFKYLENIRFQGKKGSPTLKKIGFNIMYCFMNYTVNPLNSYRLFRNIIMIFSIYMCILYIQYNNYFNFNFRAKF
jgi:8-oxo-dGTP pyrophosphatase MutT (NUDIX family)